ncbi:ead/Ea22-like family protein [Escherichia coli]|uniref:ead/Ea22-like family protein n=1 Tax=Escherichia coli TaxID=562 RepID=UPI0016B9B7DB|nr:ead/Ea22-like family protein [Escherichia coli]EFI8984369.1 ead/Ea22-like family protein [Escherichia coli]EFU2702340.1 ead/Ea22-like family protein [Escherichia coli]EGB1671891.1 ead/Ea22-like family protein [Escherichia coli]EGF1750955.1 ead/Ea22-like family protein [Escherichia coli]MCE9975913.1 ead/Ea22-like family protein [Escherichia coli]
MKFSELVNCILSNRHSQRRDMDITIVVHSPGSIGSTPSVAVRSIRAGFDWDSGKMLIFPAQPLTTLTTEQVADITESVRKGQSWHAYQAYRKHKEQLEKVTIELEEAKSKLNEQREYYEGVISDGSKRIAELDAREVTLPAEKFCPAEHAGCLLWAETEVWNRAISACAVAIRAAGIRIKGENGASIKD